MKPLDSPAQLQWERRPLLSLVLPILLATCLCPPCHLQPSDSSLHGTAIMPSCVGIARTSLTAFEKPNLKSFHSVSSSISDYPLPSYLNTFSALCNPVSTLLSPRLTNAQNCGGVCIFIFHLLHSDFLLTHFKLNQYVFTTTMCHLLIPNTGSIVH